MIALDAIDTDIFDTVLGMLPLLGFGLLALLGLVLLLLGRKLVRVACTVSGVALGTMGGLWVGWAIGSGTVGTIALAVAGLIIGGLLAGLTFRLWVALAGAALLALAAPAAGVIWYGPVAAPDVAPAATPATPATPADAADPAPASPDAAALAPEGDTDAGQAYQRAMELIQQWFAREEAPEPDAEQLDPETRSQLEAMNFNAEQIQQLIDAVAEAVRNWYGLQMDRVGGWWEDLGAGTRRFIYIVAALGALAGLGFGLIAPTLAASFESALVGAMLIFVAVRELLVRYAPGAGGYVPDTPRGVLLLVGLITIIGFLLQWTFARARVDKK
ncbi:MAG: hypothetical protein WD316_00175 [Phycisphaeraceae bacterium]